jgi:hypothetical protein
MKYEDFTFGLMGGIPEPELTQREHDLNRQMTIEEWSYGPEAPSLAKGSNRPFYDQIARAWSIEPDEARRRMCGNCEYFKNCTETQAMLEAIRVTPYDEAGGPRGYCEEHQFACGAARVCKSWEEVEKEEEYD